VTEHLPVDYLTVEDMLELVDLERLGPVRDVGLLESAAHRPATAVFGEEAYPELATKAGALLHSLVRNHALVDGNKRLGWLACRTFLLINGMRTSLSQDEAVQLVLDVASGQLDDVVEIGNRLHTRWGDKEDLLLAPSDAF